MRIEYELCKLNWRPLKESGFPVAKPPGVLILIVVSLNSPHDYQMDKVSVRPYSSAANIFASVPLSTLYVRSIREAIRSRFIPLVSNMSKVSHA